MIEQRIVLEPVSTGTLFAAHRLVELRGPMPSLTIVRDTSLKQGEDAASVTYGNLPPPHLLHRPLRHARPDRARAARRRGPFLPRRDQEVLPSTAAQPGPAHRRVRPRNHAQARRRLTTRRARLKHFFKTQFSYSLDVKRTDGDPLAEFLFETREGHCEYFATAMAIMLRTLGIPARIVNGFQMGEYNDINNLYTVREATRIRGSRSISLKRTPGSSSTPRRAAGINDYSQGGLLARLRKYMEAAEVFWLDYIVTLDSDEQASIMVELQQRTLAMKDQLVALLHGIQAVDEEHGQPTAGRARMEHRRLAVACGAGAGAGADGHRAEHTALAQEAAEERAHGLRPVVAPLFRSADLAQVASGRARPPRVGCALLRADAPDCRSRGACETARSDACGVRRRSRASIRYARSQMFTTASGSAGRASMKTRPGGFQACLRRCVKRCVRNKEPSS